MSTKTQTSLEGATISSPRPFSEMPDLWLQLFKMDETFFRQEAPRANSTNTLWSVLIYTIVMTIFSTASTMLSMTETMSSFPPEYRDFFPTLDMLILFWGCGSLLITPIAFYIGNGILYLSARIFGGQGDFTTQAYLQVLYLIPIGLLSAVIYLLSFIPLAGDVLYALTAIALSIFSIILNVRLLKVTHNISIGRAILALFAPGLILILLFGCLFYITFSSAGPDFTENLYGLTLLQAYFAH